MKIKRPWLPAVNKSSKDCAPWTIWPDPLGDGKGHWCCSSDKGRNTLPVLIAASPWNSSQSRSLHHSQDLPQQLLCFLTLPNHLAQLGTNTRSGQGTSSHFSPRKVSLFFQKKDLSAELTAFIMQLIDRKRMVKPR